MLSKSGPWILLTLTVLWFVGAGLVYASYRGDRDGWSSAPLGVLLLLYMAPLSSLILAPLLLRARRQTGQGLSGFDYSVLIIASVPVLVSGGVLIAARLTQ